MLRGAIVGHRQKPDAMTDRQHWFEDLASHMKSAYLRYSFTKGTVQEIDFIVSATKVSKGMRVLDVGCGPGRHSLELARRGFDVIGLDVSSEFVDIATQQAIKEHLHDCSFIKVDARNLADQKSLQNSFDLAICLCQGAFGLMIDDKHDVDVLRGIHSCLKEGGVIVLSAFNAYFSVRHHDAAEFDALRGVSHESTEVRNEQGEPKTVDLWTGCYTPRELRMVFDSAGFEILSISGVEPGQYSMAECSIDLPEYLVIARSR